MILQNIIFPDISICPNKEMYFRTTENQKDCIFENQIELNENEAIFSDTYFNAFSQEKWFRYTNIKDIFLNLRLKGRFKVELVNKQLFNNSIESKIISSKVLDFVETTEVFIQYSSSYTQGLLCFNLISLADGSVFSGGYYGCNENDIEESDINIALCICTFKREKYIEQNMKLLEKQILANSESALKDHLYVYISDNGNSLNTKDFRSEYIKILPNLNLGGVGGFTRGIIEANVDKEEKNITHILLMDDDVIIESESLYRTYSFLRILKPEYKDAFIGGATMRLDFQNILYEQGALWNSGNISIPKFCLDVNSLYNILRNEKEDNIDYIGWWYCCMPINIAHNQNLPLPIFIFRDDIEYCLRNCKKVITFNGICVWHEPFDKKDASMMDYYGYRNMAIVNAIHLKNWTKKQYKQFIVKQLFKNILIYRYKNARLNLRAAEDFCRGIEWIKSVDAEALHREIMDNTYKYKELNSLNCFFDYNMYLNSLNYIGNRRLVRKLSLNGYFFKACNYQIVPAANPLIEKFYRANYVLNYDSSNNKGFLTNRDKKEVKNIIKELIRVNKVINKNFDRVTKEYKERYSELVSINFWSEYLKLDNRENINEL